MATQLVNVGDPLDTRAYETSAYVDEVVPLKDGGYTMIIRDLSSAYTSWPIDSPEYSLVTVDANGVPVGRPVSVGNIKIGGTTLIDYDFDIEGAKALADGSMLVALNARSGNTAYLGTLSRTGEVDAFYSVPLLDQNGGTTGSPYSSIAFGKDNTIALTRFASDQAGTYRTVDILNPQHKLVASVVIDRNLGADEAGSTKVTALADGRFLVTWVEEGQTSTAVKAQVVTKQGKLAGSTFVATVVRDLGTPGVTQILYELAALADGGFAVSTQSAESHYDATSGKSTIVHGNIQGKVWTLTENGTLKAGPGHVTVAHSEAASLKELEVLSDGRFIEIVKVRSAPDGVEQETTLRGYIYDSAGHATGESVDFLHARSAVARLTNFSSVTALADGEFTMTFTGSHPPLGPYHDTVQTYALSTAEFATVKGATAGNDVLKGSATLDRAESISGGDGNDRLHGFGGNDRLSGGKGDDILDGGKGGDRMGGGEGSDTYIVDHFGDIVVEGRAVGIDTVRSSVNYGLTENIENLTLTGTAAIDGHGNALANVLIGNQAANELIGFGGNDVMQGGGGDDTYYVDDAGDRVIEKLGNGNDTIKTTVSLTLTDDQSIETVEADYYDIDGAKTMTLIGNNRNNALKGHSGADIINGKGGSDILTGGDDVSASDIFVFDTALGRSNVDRITDFRSNWFASDQIHLDDVIFKGLKKGALAGSAFKNTTYGAVDADDRIIYNEKTGALFYDADGSGATKAVQFAVLGEVGATTHPELAAYHFLII